MWSALLSVMHINQNTLFPIDTEDICVYSIVKKYNKNETRSVRLSYPDPQIQLTSTLISEPSLSKTETVLSCLAKEMKINQITTLFRRTWDRKCREKAYLKIKITAPLPFLKTEY